MTLQQDQWDDPVMSMTAIYISIIPIIPMIQNMHFSNDISPKMRFLTKKSLQIVGYDRCGGSDALRMLEYVDHDENVHFKNDIKYDGKTQCQ